MKFCKNCNQMVKPNKKDWSWPIFFLLFGVGYAVYRVFLPANRCPICRGKDLISKKKAVSEGLMEA